MSDKPVLMNYAQICIAATVMNMIKCHCNLVIQSQTVIFPFAYFLTKPCLGPVCSRRHVGKFIDSKSTVAWSCISSCCRKFFALESLIHQKHEQLTQFGCISS